MVMKNKRQDGSRNFFCLFLVSVVSGKISMLKCSLNFCALLYNNLLIYLNVNIKKTGNILTVGI